MPTNNHSTWLNPLLKQFDVVELDETIHIVVEEPKNGAVKISPLTLEGTALSEVATISQDNLKPCDKPVWLAAAQVFRQNTIRLEIEELESNAKKKKKKKVVKSLAKKFDLSKKDVWFIYKKIEGATNES